MKTLLTLFLLISVCHAQTNLILSADLGSELTARTRNINLGLAFGTTNWKGDYATIGGITKTYGTKTLVAVRITGLIMINELLALYTQGDVFLSKDKEPIYKEIQGRQINVQGDVSRMELGAGMGIRKGAFLWLVGAQFDDYDPVSKYRQQPALFSKLTYNLNITKQEDRRKRYIKRVQPRRR